MNELEIKKILTKKEFLGSGEDYNNLGFYYLREEEKIGEEDFDTISDGNDYQRVCDSFENGLNFYNFKLVEVNEDNGIYKKMEGK